MKTNRIILVLCTILSISWATDGLAQNMTLRTQEHPRLLMTKSDEAAIVSAIQTDRQWAMIHSLLMQGADTILTMPIAERVVIGRRMLNVSRETLRRVLMLGYAYRISGDTKYSNRAEKELIAVAGFSDWNPSHFLDVAEMTTAVAIGYDWFYNVLSEDTKTKLKLCILQKGIDPSLNEKYNNWLDRINNWNQVCNTGMAYGAIAIYEEIPTIANMIIKRSVESVKKPMKSYAPDGAYPEGYSYWAYGTTYNVMLIDALEKSFGTDFGLSQQQGFLQTAEYMLHMIASDEESFNYADNRDSGRLSPAMFWFANKNRNHSLLWNERVLLKSGNKQKLIDYRLFTLAPIWGANINLDNLPQPQKKVFVSDRSLTPVALMRTSWETKKGVYLAFKAGSAQVSHAHLDVGSFIMVANGERWAMDFGRQDYHSLESKGIDLWNKEQDSDRWRVFRYNNLAHNTLSFDEQFQDVKGNAVIDSYSDNKDFAYAISDMTPVYSKQVEKSKRGVALVKESYVVVRDEIKTGNKETTVRWTMLTPAAVKIKGKNRIELTIKNQKLEMRIESPTNIELKTWSTAPTTEYDAENPGTILVGFETTIPANTEQVLQVRLVPHNAGKANDKIADLETWSKHKN